jgi:FecR-like protein
VFHLQFHETDAVIFSAGANMKHTQRLTNSLVACAIALAMVSSVAAQTASDGAAKVVRIKGPARYTTGNNVWQPLKVGAVLRSGSIVQTSTEQGSIVDLVLGDGNVPMPSPAAYRPNIPSSLRSTGGGYAPAAEQNVVRLHENTALSIDKLGTMQTGADQVTDTQLDLKAGRITGNVKKMSAASKYEIKLPNGVAGIRGTAYDITADGMVKVFVGSVVVAWVDPKTGNVVTQVVSGGQQYDARSGQLSPLPQSQMDELASLIRSMAITAGAGQPELTYVPDKTIQFVSPVTTSSGTPVIPASAAGSPPTTGSPTK